MNDLLFIIWKMTQGWDEEKELLTHQPWEETLTNNRRWAKTVGKSEAGQQIRELLTAAGYKHVEG